MKYQIKENTANIEISGIFDENALKDTKELFKRALKEADEIDLVFEDAKDLNINLIQLIIAFAGSAEKKNIPLYINNIPAEVKDYFELLGFHYMLSGTDDSRVMVKGVI